MADLKYTNRPGNKFEWETPKKSTQDANDAHHRISS